MEYHSTRQVARLLKVSVSLLTKAVWSGRVNPPQKSPSGNFLWTPRDVEHASWVLLGRSAGLEDGPQHIGEFLPDALTSIGQRSRLEPNGGDNQ